jgi:altronate hydrolase
MSLVTLGPAVVPENPFIRLHPDDNVVVARASLPADEVIAFEGGSIQVRQPIGAGHKVATREIQKGAVVFKYGVEIGVAAESIQAGSLVHTHNLTWDIGKKNYEFGTALTDLPHIPLIKQNTFMGYPRPDGRVGTRNYIAVVGASNCSAFVVDKVAAAFENHDFGGTGIDGVVSFPHGDGCGKSAGPDMDFLKRTIDGVVDHPNIVGAVVVGLGCEVNQIGYYMREGNERNYAAPRRGFTLQESGGTRLAVQDSVKAVRELIEEVGSFERVVCPVSKLVVGLECGGSDAFSGISANPGTGYFSDLLVKQGGTVCLSETTEVYGAEHLLTRRAVSREVGQRLLDIIDWYLDYVGRFKDAGSFDANPSPGNKAGGLTNIAEKSLGAVAKAGSSNLTAVYDYAERIDKTGFVFMNTPGYDPPSVTGMAAGGANLCIFTTGRGSCFGFPSVPVIKIASNSKTGKFMTEDMDINAGTVPDGEETIPELGERIYRFILDTASGRKTFSEELGHREFVTWRIGPTL